MILTKTIVGLVEAGSIALSPPLVFRTNVLLSGCKVLYKPSVTKASNDGKWDPASSVGVVALYVLHPGYKFKGEYLVWDLKDFSRGADLSNGATNMGHRSLKSHVSVRCGLYDGALRFPFKVDYERELTAILLVRKRHSFVTL